MRLRAPDTARIVDSDGIVEVTGRSSELFFCSRDGDGRAVLLLLVGRVDKGGMMHREGRNERDMGDT